MAKEKTKQESEVNNPEGKTMDSKSMIKENSEKRTKVRFTERKKIKIIVDNHRFYKKDELYDPHVVMADQLIKEGIAKEVK